MAKEKQRFEYKLTLGKHPITGETIRRSFYSSKSLRDAKKKPRNSSAITSWS